MTKEKVKVGIVGSTGYAGAALVELVLKHPYFSIELLTSEQYVEQKFSTIYPEFRNSKIGSKKCESSDYKNLSRCDAVFFATPNGIAHKSAARLVKAGIKVVDLSADYRFDNLATYSKCYGFKRSDRELNKKAIYGLVELEREKIQAAVNDGDLDLISNPGCYTTASILALAPILDQHRKSKHKNGFCNPRSIIIDAKSGVSGAGRKASLDLSYNEVNDSIKAYNLAGAHRHTPELEEYFSNYIGENIQLSFSPHLVPMTRGLLATCYIDINPKLTINASVLRTIYKGFYKGESFVDVLDKDIYPQTKWVVGTNNAMMHVSYDKRLSRAIITCAIDNIVKGAAGQAMQNMNLLYGLDDQLGL